MAAWLRGCVRARVLSLGWGMNAGMFRRGLFLTRSNLGVYRVTCIVSKASGIYAGAHCRTSPGGRERHVATCKRKTDSSE